MGKKVHWWDKIVFPLRLHTFQPFHHFPEHPHFFPVFQCIWNGTFSVWDICWGACSSPEGDGQHPARRQGLSWDTAARGAAVERPPVHTQGHIPWRHCKCRKYFCLVSKSHSKLLLSTLPSSCLNAFWGVRYVRETAKHPWNWETLELSFCYLWLKQLSFIVSQSCNTE